MNLLLFKKEELNQNNELMLDKDKLQRLGHLKNLTIGSTLKVGQVNGFLGKGEVIELQDEKAKLKISLNPNESRPEEANITLILALPRPPVLGRIIQQATTFGIKRIYLIHSEKVEKSYWDAQVMQPESLQRHLELGLEQARDTIMPKVEIFKNYLPYSFLNQLLKTSFGIVLHPYSETSEVVLQNMHKSKNNKVLLPNQFATKILLVGPEGGFSEEEITKLTDIGFHTWNLGNRIFKVETAIMASLGKLLI